MIEATDITKPLQRAVLFFVVIALLNSCRSQQPVSRWHAKLNSGEIVTLEVFDTHALVKPPNAASYQVTGNKMPQLQPNGKLWFLNFPELDFERVEQ
jgi:hypothetical protein